MAFSSAKQLKGNIPLCKYNADTYQLDLHNPWTLLSAVAEIDTREDPEAKRQLLASLKRLRERDIPQYWEAVAEAVAGSYNLADELRLHLSDDEQLKEWNMNDSDIARPLFACIQ
jgi:hypothetical protein